MHFSSYIAVSALAALANAQTFTACNPMEKDCPNDPAMAATFNTDFKAGAAQVKGWKQTAGALTYSEEGAQFTVNKQGDSPTIQSETYLHFGRVEVKCKAAPGQGIISSIVLQSEDLDEVDWEFIGGVDNKVQMNYFGKGNTSTYDRMIEAPVSSVQNEMHTYTLDWTAESITFIIDGTPVRTLNYADANGGKNYPQTPSTVRIGIWAGGDPTNEKGVIEWAGGLTDYTKAPFTMTVESVKVTNYSPGKEYKWTDKSGSFESIEVIGKGDTAGAPENSNVLAPSATGTGVGLQSDINIPGVTPTGTLAPVYGTGSPAPVSSCTSSLPTYHNGTETPCSCGGTVIVTVTGPPPQHAVPTTLISSSVAPIGSGSSLIAPPVVTVPASSLPPYPTGGINTDTAVAPSVPFPTGGSPTGSNPSPPPANATTSAPAIFPGAASTNKAGALAIVVAAAAMLFV